MTTYTPRRWVHALAQLYEDHGLQVVAEDRHESPDYYMPIAAQATITGSLERGDSGAEEHANQLREEYKAGAMVDVVWTCVVGRKTS